MLEQGGDLRGGFTWKGAISVGAGRKGEGAVVEHALGEGRGSCLDAEVTEHGVGFPAAKEHDGVCASVGAE